MKSYKIELIDYTEGDLEAGIKVRVNGTKFPRELGQSYITKDKQQAIKWAVAEYDGKYLSRGGVIYDSKEDYINQMKDA
jgi:hypothetical protein